MQITKKQIEWYRNELARQGRLASEYVLSNIDTTLSIQEIKADTLEALETALQLYGDNAQITANKMFDYIMAGQGVQITAEFFLDLIIFAWVQKKIGYLLTHIQKGNPADYIKSVEKYTEWLIHRTANESMIKNVEINEIRYALIPTNAEPCGFCYMLAGRGFDYLEKTYEKYKDKDRGLGHTNCKCILLPSAKKNLDVYGADQEKWKDYYKQARKKVGGNTNDIINELEKMGRDIGWKKMY